MPAAKTRAYYEQGPADWAAVKDRLDRAAPQDRVLLKGATIVTVDPAIGDFDEGDVLIDGTRIAAVGRGPRRRGRRRQGHRHEMRRA